MLFVSTENINSIIASTFNQEAGTRASLRGFLKGLTKAKHKRSIIPAVQELREKGWTFVSVPCKKISPEQNRATLQEFTTSVTPGCFKKMATEHEQELRDAGFCDFSIECMRQGNPPMTEDGKIYFYDFDHVIERALSGQLGIESQPDPDWPANDPEKPEQTLKVNHMFNLCFIPRDEHEAKNKVIQKQVGDMKAGETRNIILPIPPRDEHCPMIRKGMKIVAKEITDLRFSSYSAFQSSDREVDITRKLLAYGAITEEGNEENAALMNDLLDNIESSFKTLKIWHALTEKIIDQKEENSERLVRAERLSLEENCKILEKNLKEISNVLPYLAEDANKIIESFPSLFRLNMSKEQPTIQEDNRKPTLS